MRRGHGANSTEHAPSPTNRQRRPSGTVAVRGIAMSPTGTIATAIAATVLLLDDDHRRLANAVSPTSGGRQTRHMSPRANSSATIGTMAVGGSPATTTHDRSDASRSAKDLSAIQPHPQAPVFRRQPVLRAPRASSARSNLSRRPSHQPPPSPFRPHRRTSWDGGSTLLLPDPQLRVSPMIRRPITAPTSATPLTSRP